MIIIVLVRMVKVDDHGVTYPVHKSVAISFQDFPPAYMTWFITGTHAASPRHVV